MKHHEQSIGAVFAVLIMMVGLTGCTQQNTQNQVPPTKESVQAILSKAETIESMSYNINGSLNLTSYVTEVLGMKVWHKNPYLKENITVYPLGIPITTTIIQRPEGTYIYNNNTGKYELNSSIPSFVTAFKYIDPVMIKDLLNNQTITHFDTAVLDGKQTTVLNYTVPLQGNYSIKVIVWIWNDMGIPLKALLEMNTIIKMNIDIRFTNYSFASIPDSEFDVT